MTDEKQNQKALLEKMLEAEQQIQQAILEFSNREAIFEDVCREIQSSLGLDFCLISLVNPEQDINQTVYESNFNGANLTHRYIRYKYYLEKNPDLRSIRADIIQTRNIEIISGWDKRLTQGIYKKEKLRIFIPIILIQDKNGNIIEDWFENCEWEVVTQEQTKDGYRTVIKMDLSVQENETLGNIQVIGVVAAIHANHSQQITVEQVITSAKLVAQQALKIRRAQLSYILEVIAENARRILKADVAAVDFMYQPEQQDYIYQVIRGKIAENFWENFTSRKQALGQQTLKEGKTIFVTGSQQNCFNNLAKLLGKKSKAIVAFPLQVENKKGVLYLEFHDEHEFTEDEISLLNLFANRANSAILHTIIKADNHVQETQLTNLYLFTRSLTHETENEVLLRRIVWYMLNILGADVVIFNEYLQVKNENESKVITPPEIAGRLIQEDSSYPELYKDDDSSMLIKHGKNIYESSLDNSKIFKNSYFVKQERIKSVASILLKVGEETVGVMFIHYRRIYKFSKYEQKLIETLTSSAAYAIKNQRWLQTRLDTIKYIDRELISTLEEKKLLDLILQLAVEKTKADFGDIALLQLKLNGWELETKALYPENSHKEKIGIGKRIEYGITKRVAKNRCAKLVNDVRQDPNYKELFPNVRSELCVPLLDRQDRLIGVLNVESNQVNAFNQRDLLLLQEMADLAVIAIKNARKQEQLAKIEAMATLGDIAGPLVHRVNNNVGAIRVWAQDICEQGDGNIESLAKEILSLTEQILKYSQRMRSWITDQPKTINIRDIVQESLARLELQIPDNIKQNINIEDGISDVFAGQQQLVNVFENFIQNAINAMPNGGELSIRGSNLKTDSGTLVKVSVCDTGIGIPTENFQNIFEPGYSTKDSNTNLGFGLWWTKFYIQRLEGDIEVESEIDKGTQFTIIIPAHNQ